MWREEKKAGLGKRIHSQQIPIQSHAELPSELSWVEARGQDLYSPSSTICGMWPSLGRGCNHGQGHFQRGLIVKGHILVIFQHLGEQFLHHWGELWEAYHTVHHSPLQCLCSWSKSKPRNDLPLTIVLCGSCELFKGGYDILFIFAISCLFQDAHSVSHGVLNGALILQCLLGFDIIICCLRTAWLEFLKTPVIRRRVFDIKGEGLEHSLLISPSQELCAPNALKSSENIWFFHTFKLLHVLFPWTRMPICLSFCLHSLFSPFLRILWNSAQMLHLLQNIFWVSPLTLPSGLFVFSVFCRDFLLALFSLL